MGPRTRPFVFESNALRFWARTSLDVERELAARL